MIKLYKTFKFKNTRNSFNSGGFRSDANFSNDLIEYSSSVVSGERALYAARKADLNAQLSVLTQQLIQREQQINEVKVNITTAQDTIKLLEKQISIIEPLVKSGLSPETELLALQRQLKDFQGKQQVSEASLLRIQSSILEVEKEIYSTKQNYSTSSQSELSKIIAQIAEIESRIPALEDRVKRTKLYAPVKGVVNRINFKTLGGFVTTGDIILELVPTGDDLIVEGKIDPKDSAYISLTKM